MVDEVERHCRERSRQVLADSGFYSGANLDGLETRGIDGYVADTNLTAALKQGGEVKAGNRRVRHGETLRMREKLPSPSGRRTYLYPKAMGAPGIGSLKQPRGPPPFPRRGPPPGHTAWPLAAHHHKLTRRPPLPRPG